MTVLQLQGYAKDITYTPKLSPILNSYPLENFNINDASPSGIVTFGQDDQIAYSQWVSPKRTRSYPFARIYNRYHLNTKRVTIIPIIKDEGAKGDMDRINFITFSWMSLLNIYIILAWYESAIPNPRNPNKITEQKFNNAYIKAQIEQLSRYQVSALHWNTTHFTQNFEPVLNQAIHSYAQISQQTGVVLHSPKRNFEFLRNCQQNGVFTIEGFKSATLESSLRAARRETKTTHKHELLSHNAKAIIELSNYLGGQYYLTVDEVFEENGRMILQESKNSTLGAALPSKDDIKDGLFKLILFANLDELWLNNQKVEFSARLCLTGNFSGELNLSADQEYISQFCDYNNLNVNERTLIEKLQQEVSANQNISIVLKGHR